ncbi:MAG: PD-(D/E)XK nuclease family protein, partial [Candidatus Dadabacteria bacterium]|nr:PD-(D/E)XK nuclease family protein [Candidatus Dadabacteria bacterium]
ACAIFYGGRIKLSMGEGNPPPIELADQIKCPVAGFFGEDDKNPTPADVDDYSRALENAGVHHEFHRYEDAAHAFQNFPSPEHYREVGRQCLRDYYGDHHPFADGKTVGLENWVNVDLDGSSLYRLRGKIDRLVDKGDGLYEIHDYKTSARLPTQADADEDQQLARYQLAVQEMWPDVKEVRLAWHYLRFGKMLVSTRTAEELGELRQETIEAIQTIEAATEYEPVKNPLCDWCDYKSICPLWVHLDRIKVLPPEEVAIEDGVVLVDRLAQLQVKNKECEEQIEQVKEAIAAFGEKEGASVVFGTTHQAKITKSSGVRYPSAGDPDREEIERVLKEAGKWDEVSHLNTRSLAKLVEEGTFGPELEKQVEAFRETYETTSVRLSKRKDAEE